MLRRSVDRDWVIGDVVASGTLREINCVLDLVWRSRRGDLPITLSGLAGLDAASRFCGSEGGFLCG